MTETEALTAIAALCEDTDEEMGYHLRTEAVRAILDRVGSGAVPPQDIDRDALEAILRRWAYELSGRHAVVTAGARDAILALVRPAPGVTLTPEEVRVVRWLITFWGGCASEQERKAIPPHRESINALAEKLEAAS